MAGSAPYYSQMIGMDLTEEKNIAIRLRYQSDISKCFHDYQQLIFAHILFHVLKPIREIDGNADEQRRDVKRGKEAKRKKEK